MYYYAEIESGTRVVVRFFESDEPIEEYDIIQVDAIDETWIRRKKYNDETQTWSDVTLDETTTNNSLEFTHIDSDGTKHWLDEFVNNLASGGSVETATVSEVETYLGI